MHGQPWHAGAAWRKLCDAELGFSTHGGDKDGCCRWPDGTGRNLLAALTRSWWTWIAAELAKLSDVVQMPICSDAGVFLREMLAQRASIATIDRCEWKTRCMDWKSRYPVIRKEHRTKGAGEHLSPGGGDFSGGGTGRSDCLRQCRHWYRDLSLGLSFEDRAENLSHRRTRRNGVWDRRQHRRESGNWTQPHNLR